MPNVRASHVLERTEGRAVVEQEAVARFLMFSKRIHLVLEIQEKPGTIRFRDRCEKSFERYEGVWTVKEQDGHAVITYELTAKPLFDMPSFMLKRLLRSDSAQMIEHLQREISARTTLLSKTIDARFHVTCDGQRFLMIGDADQDTSSSRQIVVVLGWSDELTRLSSRT